MVEDALTHVPAKVGGGQSPELLVLVGVPPGTHRRCDKWFLATRFRVWGRLVATGVRDKESKNSGARQSVVLDRILPRLTCSLTSGATSQTPVPAVVCPPLAGFLASPEFPVLRSIISSLDFSTLSSPREPRFRLDSRAPHVSFRLLPDPLSSHSPLRSIVDSGCRPGVAAVRSTQARWRPDGLRVSRRQFVCGSLATTHSTDRLQFRGDDSLDGSFAVPWRRLARRIARGDGR